MEISLEKSGEKILVATLERPIKWAKQGIGTTISFKVHPAVEEYFHNLVVGDAHNIVTTWGRLWAPIGSDTLLVYELPLSLSGPQGTPPNIYHLDIPGRAMTYREPDGTEAINLSFLRIVGASKGEGITFGVKGVFTVPTLQMWREQILRASRIFYRDFLQPVALTITLTASMQDFARPLNTMEETVTF